MKTKSKNKKSNRPGCWTLAVLALIGLSLLPSSNQAQAQTDVDDFVHGQGAPADNGDSVFVPGVKMGRPSHGGSGCTSGTVAAVLSPDQKTLSMLFDNYIVEAGDSFGNRRGLKSCQISVPFKVPSGYQVSVVKLDYRGFHSIPVNGFAHYDATYYMSDAQTGQISRRRIRRKLNVRGPEDGDFVINSQVRGRQMWSNCGRDFNLHINTNITAMSNNSGDDTMAILDSIDARAEQTVDYHLVWKPCRDSGPGRPPVVNPGRPPRPPVINPGRPGGPGRPNPPGRPPRFGGRGRHG
ncbi:MAG: DUF4360 domain-containing protein [Bdellovibrionaceae bacterium]|nr:DUF4360 domain-containing protein [Bdellovibrionales bacterium]MCB9084041.1 DUF4360 domain-containing protein [Pseudobdellovibrionaceae bacterium]